jgi:hypothetical protein
MTRSDHVGGIVRRNPGSVIERLSKSGVPLTNVPDAVALGDGTIDPLGDSD